MNLKFDFNAIEYLDEQHGIELLEVALRGTQPKTKELVALVHAGQLHEKPDLTLEEVRAQLNSMAIMDIVNPVVSAIAEAYKLTASEEDDAAE